MYKKGLMIGLCIFLCACSSTEVSQNSASEETIADISTLKPHLSIIGEEVQDYSRSMQNKIDVLKLNNLN